MLKRLLSRSLRFKILFGLLLSLAPLLAIVGITYYSALSTAENSKRIMNILSRSGAREIDTFIETQKTRFLNWTAKDIYGMAIQFQTTNMEDKFSSYLEEDPGFSLLMLVDMEGKVLVTASAGARKDEAKGRFLGRSLEGVSELSDKPPRSAALAKSALVKEILPGSGHTFMFSFKTANFEREPNGYFIAFVDWAKVQEKVNTLHEEMKGNGFNKLNIAVLNRSSGLALSHSDEKMTGSSLEMPDSLKAWLQGTESGQVRGFEFGKKSEYLTFYPILSPEGLFDEKGRDRNHSDLCFTVSVDRADIMSDVRRILWASGGVAGIGAVVVVLIGLFIVRLISRPLDRIIGGLGENSNRLASSSEKVTSASQSGAEGASEQAASLEETSSSMEQMSSMTEQNAVNAQQANHLMNQANEVVSRANESLAQLTASMIEISKASEKTSKIIKTIDEIAFQTNLLALNAAVEAARAGEAGAGFAVVADEVRNLAMRAAQAARDTAGLLDGTVKKIKEGSDLVTRTNDAFSRVSESSSRVGELVAEIAAASKEQAQGIDQVSKAVAEMDKITQRNASNAEENAGAAKEMNVQADQMAGYVAELMSLVGGSGRRSSNGHGAVVQQGLAVRRNKTLAAASGKLGKSTATVPKAKVLHPGPMIPLEDKDLNDF